MHKIVKNNLLKLEDDEEAKIHYHSINKFYKLVRTDKNINGINIEINKEIETIREIIGIIEGMFSQVYFSKASKKEIESEMKDIMEKYGSSSNIERHLEYTVGNIISVCKERML